MSCITLLHMKEYETQHRNNKFKILGATWDKEFELTGGFYSVSGIHNCFEYITKKNEILTDDTSNEIYINQIQNKITFKIKSVYYLELLTPKTIKLLGNNQRQITKYKNGVNLPQLEITEVVSVHCDIVNNQYDY